MRLSEALIIGFALACLAGCATERSKRDEFFAPKETVTQTKKGKKNQQPPPYTRDEAETAICEAVVLRFTRDASVREKEPVNRVFVGFTTDNVDPAPRFIERFRSQKIQVLPASAGSKSEDKGGTEAKAGKRSVSLRIDRIDWGDFYNVRVPCFRSARPGEGVDFTYPLSWKRGKWIVP